MTPPGRRRRRADCSCLVVPVLSLARHKSVRAFWDKRRGRDEVACLPLCPAFSRTSPFCRQFGATLLIAEAPCRNLGAAARHCKNGGSRTTSRRRRVVAAACPHDGLASSVCCTPRFCMWPSTAGRPKRRRRRRRRVRGGAVQWRAAVGVSGGARGVPGQHSSLSPRPAPCIHHPAHPGRHWGGPPSGRTARGGVVARYSLAEAGGGLVACVRCVALQQADWCSRCAAGGFPDVTGLGAASPPPALSLWPTTFSCCRARCPGQTPGRPAGVWTTPDLWAGWALGTGPGPSGARPPRRRASPVRAQSRAELSARSRAHVRAPAGRAKRLSLPPRRCVSFPFFPLPGFSFPRPH